MINRLRRYPNMRNSGVGSLGDVPVHWEICALRRRLRPYDGIKIGPFGSQIKLEIMTSSGYKVYGQANVIARDFEQGTKFIDEEKFQELCACSVEAGDVLVTMMGTSGRCAIVPQGAAPGIMDSHLLRLRLDPTLDTAFCQVLIDQAAYIKQQILVAGKGAIMHGLNSAIVKDLVIALPPLCEQRDIVLFVEHASQQIERYIQANAKLIGWSRSSSDKAGSLIEEYRARLIADLVTGKLDVREAASALPGASSVRRSRVTRIPIKGRGRNSTNEVTAKEASP